MVKTEIGPQAEEVILQGAVSVAKEVAALEVEALWPEMEETGGLSFHHYIHIVTCSNCFSRDGGGGGNNPGNNLHVSGLSSKVDTRDLEAAFAKVGRVCSIKFVIEMDIYDFYQVQKASVMYDPHTRESRGFGFVTMESAEEADAAITALNATEFLGKTITVEKVCYFLPLQVLLIHATLIVSL